MTKDYQVSKPIYIQIADTIAYRIVRGEMLPGEKLPSVREMAVESSVNPNTIQRTYSEMERMGIVETKRGQGTFVTDNEEVLDDLKGKLQNDIIHVFVKSMEELGMTEEEMIHGLKCFLGRDRDDR
ncbi:GntR family transcriptional regulator [Virgibacillus alimentarius]|uniref:GntR family transcriptional regulator n=1 Tax=Virgibacillus alimentarius TaxID=698769 RepID=A0ABS4SC65_9BACI|nr:GntR family transcriptional regulator [Virgibacillus alimentarius]MBP2258999.1 GntR family transcriptional regulator [Virgibacillus alimentarius]